MIPSGYYERSDGIDAAEVRVVQFGVPRSGSTFVWQCLRDLCPDGGVVKTHDWLDLDVPVVVTFRDWRDVMVSHWRFHEVGEAMSREAIYRHAGLCRRWSWLLGQYCGMGNCLAFRYELLHRGLYRDDWGSLVESIRSMAGALGIPGVSDVRCREIAEAHSMERNRHNSPKRGQPYDPGTLLHPNHIHEGEIGGWRRFVRQDEHQLVNDLLGNLLETWGYCV